MKYRGNDIVYTVIREDISGSGAERKRQFESRFNCKIVNEASDQYLDEPNWYLVFDSEEDYNYFLLFTK